MHQHTTPPVAPPATQPPHTVTTRTSIIERGNDGIVHASHIALDETVDDARKNVAAMRQLSPESRALVLVDARTNGTVPPEVRSYYVSGVAIPYQSIMICNLLLSTYERQ